MLAEPRRHEARVVGVQLRCETLGSRIQRHCQHGTTSHKRFYSTLDKAVKVVDACVMGCTSAGRGGHHSRRRPQAQLSHDACTSRYFFVT